MVKILEKMAKIYGFYFSIFKHSEKLGQKLNVFSNHKFPRVRDFITFIFKYNFECEPICFCSLSVLWAQPKRHRCGAVEFLLRKAPVRVGGVHSPPPHGPWSMAKSH